MTIIVSKLGSPLYVANADGVLAGATPRGEHGDGEGILRWLLKNNYDFIYFGQYRGPILPGLRIVESYTQGLTAYSSHAEQCEGWSIDKANIEKALDGRSVDLHLHIAGYAPTMATVKNGTFSCIQDCAIKRTGPILGAVRAFPAPRIILNNDPKTYPKEQEMTYGWPELIPSAVLDQRSSEVVTRIGGKKYKRRTVWAKSESWCHISEHTNTREHALNVIAHCHVADGYKQKARDKTWTQLLGDLSLFSHDFKIYGGGWESWSGYDGNSQFQGLVSEVEITCVIASTRCAPCVTPGPGAHTSKPYIFLAHGCVPLLYGDGNDPYTYDMEGEMLPLNSPWRVTSPSKLIEVAEALSHDGFMDKELEIWRDRLKPDFSLLARCLDDILSGRKIRDVSWFEQYGGYWRV